MDIGTYLWGGGGGGGAVIFLPEKKIVKRKNAITHDTGLSVNLRGLDCRPLRFSRSVVKETLLIKSCAETEQA